MDEIIEYINEIIRVLPYDLRAEVIIAELLDRGLSADDFIVSPKGSFKRRFRKDIETIEVKETQSGQRYVQIEVNREGIYDSLPQALIHEPERKRTVAGKTTKEMVEEVKEIKKEEIAARKFFLPFENEFYRQGVQLEIEEHDILKGYENLSKHSVLLNKFWQLPELFDGRQKAILIYLFPIIHKAVGNLKLTKLCYETILNAEINFTMRNGLDYEVKNEYALNDSKLRLGVNFVCGSEFSNNKQYLEITVRLVNDKEIFSYLPGGNGLKILAFLNGFFLPMETDWRLVYKVNTDGRSFVLNDDTVSSRLGLATII